MTWYRDLHRCRYFDGPDLRRSSVLRAVGWLERGHPYATGDFDPVLFSVLGELAKKPCEIPMFWGYHACSLYEESGDFTNSEQGARNLFIPGPGLIFVAPELILHYMKHHGYRPPEQFRAAALACPPMWSAAYFRLIKRNGRDALGFPFSRPSLRMRFRLKVMSILKRPRARR